MNKKVFLSIAIVLCATLLSGCWGQKDEEQIVEEVGFTNLTDAIGSGETLECTYSISQGGQEIKQTMYMEGDKYRIEYEADGLANYSIYDGKDHYSWGMLPGKGFKISDDCLVNEVGANTSEDTIETEGFDVDSSFVASDELGTAVNVECKEVDSIDLSIPTDVEFTDQCEILKQAQEQLQELQQQINQLGN